MTLAAVAASVAPSSGGRLAADAVLQATTTANNVLNPFNIGLL